MAFRDHVTTARRYPAHIVAVDPATRTVQAVMRAGSVRVSAYTGMPLSRWPQVGENWIIKGENGSWYLDSILQDDSDPTQGSSLEPGDALINAPNSGKVHLSSGHTVARKFTAIVGDGTNDIWTVYHGLNDLSLNVSVISTESPYEPITAFSWLPTSVNAIKVTFETAPAKEGAQVVIIG